MADDDLRFGDVGGGSGGGDVITGLIDLAIRGTILIVVVWALYGVVDRTVFGGALPF